MVEVELKIIFNNISINYMISKWIFSHVMPILGTWSDNRQNLALLPAIFHLQLKDAFFAMIVFSFGVSVIFSSPDP